MLFSRRILLSALFCFGLLHAAGFALKDGDVVVFYGDSITDQRLYTTFVENYVLTRFPQMHVKFVHSGWGGDRVSGGGGGPIDIRMQRDILAYKPTVLTIMLGMNDARYRAYDPQIFEDFSKGYTHIVKTVKAALPGVRITVIVPSPYDDVTRKPLFDPGYNTVLLKYGDFVRDLAKQEDLNVADLNTGVVAALSKANTTDPVNALKMIPDRVHPGPSGHLLMAEALLKSWNAPALVTDTEIDAAAGSASNSVGADVSGIEKTDHGISWTETDAALPLPVDWNDPLIKLAADSSDVVDALDREPLRVTGLTSGNYLLTIDGLDMGIYSSSQLAAGINLALLQTPMAKQADEVAHLTFAHNNVHFARWRTVEVPLEKYGFSAAAPAMSDLDSLETQIVAARFTAAQPKPHHYEIKVQ